VPVGLKDLTDTAGVRTTYASRLYKDYEPAQDSEVAARILGAGATLLGKTATPEFGLNASNEGGIFPATANPWNLERSAGGSSSGAAAALAARMLPLAQGTDGGGSVRIPAAACGVVGLKPSRARVPSAPLSGVAWAGLATSGPMARTVGDVAMLLDVMAGPALADPFPTLNPSESFASAVGEAPGRLRIGWTTTSHAGPVMPDVARAVEQAAQALAAAGHELVEAAPDTRDMWQTFLTIVNAHTAARPIDDPSQLGEHARAVYEAGLSLSAGEYLRAEQAMYQHCRRVLGWFADYDLLLCPTLPETALPLGVLAGAGPAVWDRLESYIAFTFWGNMTGQPGISLPLALAGDGLPIGVQLVGRQLADRTVLSVAAQLEQALPWAERMPEMARV
jgi:amidase/aspartyl-tRNA(Asn)/glutamyl-tRNA(Gln) amidotransferase subunit A